MTDCLLDKGPHGSKTTTLGLCRLISHMQLTNSKKPKSQTHLVQTIPFSLRPVTRPFEPLLEKQMGFSPDLSSPSATGCPGVLHVHTHRLLEASRQLTNSSGQAKQNQLFSNIGHSKEHSGCWASPTPLTATTLMAALNATRHLPRGKPCERFASLPWLLG